MTQITIPQLPLSTVIPLNSLIPFENIQNNETQATTLSTILSNVVPSTKLYLNNILSGTYPALNFVSGSNISFTESSTNNYKTITINSTIPNPLTITNVGNGTSLYKNFTSTYNFKTLIAGSNVSISPSTDTVTISVNNVGEINTASNSGAGIGLFKDKTGVNLNFKSIIAGNNISFDTSNANQIVINSTGGSSNSTGQNIGAGIGRVYVSNLASVLRFKSIKAGNNIQIINGASEIIISATPLTNTEGGLPNSENGGTNPSLIGNSNLINLSGQLKSLIAGDGLIFADSTEDSLTLATNVTNGMANVGAGIELYKGFNSELDRYELKTIKGLDGLIVEDLNDNEIVIRGNSTASIDSTSEINSLISNQVESLTTLKVINTSDSDVASITDTTDSLTLNILNNNNQWNANKINNVPITNNVIPAEESTLVYRNNTYVTGTPANLTLKYLIEQTFGQLIPLNNQVLKVSGNNQWALAVPADHSTYHVNFLGFYLNSKVYTSGSVIEGLTGLVAGTLYYLNSSSTYSTTSSALALGIALNTTTLWFKPYAP
jgi:hypothetical protein